MCDALYKLMFVFFINSLHHLAMEVMQAVLFDVGGRMCTKYSVTNDCGVDLGAQYITATADSYRRHKTYPYGHDLSI